jgi:hypothetical protein
VVPPQARTGLDFVGTKHHEDTWRTLVHVCKRWRRVVFASPRRLDLRLLCTNRRPVKKMLNIWPPLPIYIYAYCENPKLSRSGVTNIIAALKEHSRVFGIHINGVTHWLLKRIATIKQFPALRDLSLRSFEKTLTLPDSFLGGSAPRLRTLHLEGIPFPGLGKLLSSTTDLVSLSLCDIPNSGYISPETMVTNLSTLTRLKCLHLDFRSPQPRADQENQHPPPLPRTVLPALTQLHFKGDREYWEDIFSRIDIPPVNTPDITSIFFDELVFNAPRRRRRRSYRHPICRVGSPDAWWDIRNTEAIFASTAHCPSPCSCASYIWSRFQPLCIASPGPLSFHHPHTSAIPLQPS